MWLYHVTYLFNLPGIARDRLRPGSGQNFGEGYRSYAAGWLFLTEGDGVSFWASRLEEHAEAVTEHPEEGWVPVVLSFDAEELDLVEDTIGTSDAVAEAWKTRENIAVEDLYIWNGEEWVDTEKIDVESMLEEVLEASELECEEIDPSQAGEEDVESGECWWLLDYEHFLPPDEVLGDEP